METKTYDFGVRKCKVLFSSPKENAKLFIILDGELIQFNEVRNDVIYALISSSERLDDYTPYPEPALNKKFNDFGGKGYEFLDFVKKDILTTLEKDFSFDHDNIIYGGISLGGLHAVFSSVHDSPFKHYFSIVGSFWYPGFVDFIKEKQVPKDITYTLVNGKREGSNHPGFLLNDAPIKAQELYDVLKEKNENVDSYFDDYGHHNKITERFQEVERRIRASLQF